MASTGTHWIDMAARSSQLPLFLGKWILANTIFVPLRILLTQLIVVNSGISGNLIIGNPEDSSGEFFIRYSLVGVITGLLEGTIIGSGQWWALRDLLI